MLGELVAHGAKVAVGVAVEGGINDRPPLRIRELASAKMLEKLDIAGSLSALEKLSDCG